MKANRWYHFLILFLVATLVWLFMSPGKSEPVSVGLAEAAGVAIIYLLMSLFIVSIPATAYRIKAKAWPTWISSGTAIVLAAILYFAIHGLSQRAGVSPGYFNSVFGESTESGPATYMFTRPECELGVVFPEMPSYRTQHGPENISFTEATLALGDTMLRAECTDYDGLWRAHGDDARDEDWVDWMRSYMQAQGMHVDSLTSDPQELSGRRVHVTEGRGSKIIGDRIQTTYKVKLVAARDSIIIMYAANPSHLFPSRSASRFLNGVQWSSQ